MAIATADSILLKGFTFGKPSAVFAGADDYIQIDEFITDRNTANDAVGTFTAWVMVEDNTGTYAIIGGGDADVVEYIFLAIEAGTLYARLNVNTTDSWDINTAANTIPVHKWTHVALTQDGTRPKLYINGELMAMTDTDASNLTHWIANATNLDQGHIGIAEVSGNATTTLDYVGAISDVKYWNVALTPQQVKDDYKGIPNTTSLISHWDMDLDVLDRVIASNNDGTIVSAVYLDPNYTDIISKLKLYDAVVADDISISVDGDRIVAILVKA